MTPCRLRTVNASGFGVRRRAWAPVIAIFAADVALAVLLAGCPAGDVLEDCVERCLHTGVVVTKDRLPVEVHARERGSCEDACAAIEDLK